MTIDQILTLIGAGYTKNEIETLSSQTSAPAPETTTPAPAEQMTAPAPAEPTTQEVETPVDPVTSAEPTAPAPDDAARWAALLAEISDMKKAIHGQNIRRGVDTPAPKPIDEELAEQWIANGESKKK
jgi:hypothetical protein|nr:MAG TPA: hypothetical protein [Caudoviricetes sp.]